MSSKWKTLVREVLYREWGKLYLREDKVFNGRITYDKNDVGLSLTSSTSLFGEDLNYCNNQ